MSRLTKRISMENEDIIIYGEGKYTNITVGDMKPSDIIKVMRKLAEYEDLEEQGLLLKLPFDVNSEVFIVSKQFILERNCMEYEVKKLKVRDFNYNFLHNFTIVCEERIGDSICQRHLFNTDKIFLTKEEAEKELKRLERKNENRKSDGNDN